MPNQRILIPNHDRILQNRFVSYYLFLIKFDNISDNIGTIIKHIINAIANPCFSILYIELEIKQYMKIPHTIINPTFATFAAV